MSKFVNLQYLIDICEGDNEAMKDLIQMFLDQRDEIKTRLIENFEAQDWKALSETAHLAKSTLKVVGVYSIADKMAKLEEYTRDEQKQQEYKELIDFYFANIEDASAELIAEKDKL